jgi:hypothetical protein
MATSDIPLSVAGDCFVVWSAEGLFWDGEGWVPEWQRARQFGGPVDPFPEAQELADLLRAGGTPCNVAYIHRTKVRARQVPRHKARAGVERG